MADLGGDLSEAQQTLGGHKANAQAAAQRQARIAELRETAGLLQRRQKKLGADQARAAAEHLVDLEAQAAAVPDATAIQNAEQAINELRQERDKAGAKYQALLDAHGAIAGRESAITEAAQHHADVVAWSLIAEALAPTGIPAEILAGVLDPFNELLAAQASLATWQPVMITAEIDIAYGGRLYGLLSESEKWRADTLLAIAIARLSGIRLVLLDRFDVLQPTARPQALKLLLSLNRSGDLDSAVMAGTMKEPMAKVPAGIQQVWIQSGVITNQEQASA